MLLLSGCPWEQVKDKWGYQMTARYEMYAAQLADFIKPDFKPQVSSGQLRIVNCRFCPISACHSIHCPGRQVAY